MCLETIEKFTPCRVGYKVMRCEDGELHSDVRWCSRPIPRDEWVDEAGFRPCYQFNSTIDLDNGTGTYPVGWHIFHTKKDAIDWVFENTPEVIVKVAVRSPLATGRQDGGAKVTVAKEIKILEVLAA
jgi:hypothetical protein